MLKVSFPAKDSPWKSLLDTLVQHSLSTRSELCVKCSRFKDLLPLHPRKTAEAGWEPWKGSQLVRTVMILWFLKFCLLLFQNPQESNPITEWLRLWFRNRFTAELQLWVTWLNLGTLILLVNPDAAAAAKSLQSCPTLCDPIDGSPPGSPIPGILQARTLEWVAVSFSNVWKSKVKVKSLSHVWLCATPWTAAYQAPLSMGFSRQEYWSGVKPNSA